MFFGRREREIDLKIVQFFCFCFSRWIVARLAWQLTQSVTPLTGPARNTAHRQHSSPPFIEKFGFFLIRVSARHFNHLIPGRSYRLNSATLLHLVAGKISSTRIISFSEDKKNCSRRYKKQKKQQKSRGAAALATTRKALHRREETCRLRGRHQFAAYGGRFWGRRVLSLTWISPRQVN